MVNIGHYINIFYYFKNIGRGCHIYKYYSAKTEGIEALVANVDFLMFRCAKFLQQSFFFCKNISCFSPSTIG